MTFSVPSFLAAAISAARPPPSAADVAAAQSPGLTDGDGDGDAGSDEDVTAGDVLAGESWPFAVAGEDPQPAALRATTPIPAMNFRDNFINYLALVSRRSAAACSP